MSGMDDQGAPPEVPEEYAATYRDAYQRALEAENDALVDELMTSTVGQEASGRPAWLLPAAAGGALVLVACAFVLGKMLSSDDTGDVTGEAAATATTAAPSTSPTPSPTKQSTTPKPTTKPAAKPWSGPVAPVAVNAVTASCTSDPGTDSAGQRVNYEAANTLDHDPSTAWRCDGQAIGTVLTITLPAGTEVGQVGLIPGYAKTDPKSGADRYAENNRISRVRWTLADGTVVVQKLDTSADDREVQLLRVPRTATGTVTLRILAVDRGARNTTAISEIEVYSAQ